MSLMRAIASELQDRGCGVHIHYNRLDIHQIHGINTLIGIVLDNSKLYIFFDTNPHPAIIHLADPNALDQLYALVPQQPGI